MPTKKRLEFPKQFEALWKIHPKGGKADAHKAWRRTVFDDEVDADWLHMNLRAYVQIVAATEFRFLPDLSRWLNAAYYDIPEESLKAQHRHQDHSGADLAIKKTQERLLAHKKSVLDGSSNPVTPRK